jgi:hypothetical protein
MNREAAGAAPGSDSIQKALKANIDQRWLLANR